MKKNFASHAIFAVQSDKNIISYEYNFVGKSHNQINIWFLIKTFNNLKVYLDLLNHTNEHLKAFTPEGQSILNNFGLIKHKENASSIALRGAAALIMNACPGNYLRLIQKNLAIFQKFITPQYRLLLDKIVFDLDPRNELIFHTCKPDCYLWVPHHTDRPKDIILIFLTETNTLNMPRPLAHFILSRLNIALMYIGNRRNMQTDEYLAGHNLLDSANIIQNLVNKYGYSNSYGIGASYGGYKACKLASALKLKKVLNFSGVPRAKKAEDKKSAFLSMRSNYPMENILSILSSTDLVDQKILSQYDQYGFITPRQNVESKTHGTFTAAYLENKLDHYLEWLLDE